MVNGDCPLIIVRVCFVWGSLRAVLLSWIREYRPVSLTFELIDGGEIMCLRN